MLIKKIVKLSSFLMALLFVNLAHTAISDTRQVQYHANSGMISNVDMSLLRYISAIKNALLGNENFEHYLSPWRVYMLPELNPQVGLSIITPGYHASESVIEPLMPSFLLTWDKGINTGFDLALISSSDPLFNHTQYAQHAYEISLSQSNFNQLLVSPSISHQLDQNSSWNVSAVIAYQSLSPTFFANPFADQFVGYSSSWQQSDHYYLDNAYGAGVSIALNSGLTSNVFFDVGFRTRINMDELDHYRDLFYQQADFDIPAVANVGITLRPTASTQLAFDVQHVMYSDINPNIDSYLPTRVLSLLGDGGSPEFAWEDLTIYSLGLTWNDGEDWAWQVNYATSLQPKSTSKVIQDVLAKNEIENNFNVTVTHLLNNNGQLDFMAKYAPEVYFGTPINLASEENGIANLEVLATLSWRY